MDDLEAVGRLEDFGAAGAAADAGVVAEDVERPVGGEPALSEGLDAGQAGAVELPPLNLRLLVAGDAGGGATLGDDEGGVGLFQRGVSACEDQVGAPGGHFEGGFAADTVVGAADDDPVAAQVGVRHGGVGALCAFAVLGVDPFW